MSSSRKVHTGVPQGSKLSPSLFSFYIADMPTPTEPVKRVCYADDLTVWATGVTIPDIEDSLNSYLGEITAYLKDNSLLISAPKSPVTLFTPETLLMTYKAGGRSIINYAAPVWSTNLRDTNYRNIQYTQNEALRISTGCHKMSNVDHLHVEETMLKVKEHTELLVAQYLARCLEPENVNFSITTREPPKRMMKETLFTRHRSAVEPLMIAKDRKTTLQAIHTMAVNQVSLV